jgi:predicted glycosyltransferase
MSANFAFYVHHHGSGHVMRALAIAKNLPCHSVTFLGSDLQRYGRLIPSDITCIHLPSDIAERQDVSAKMLDINLLHYAPLNVKGLADRASILINTLQQISPALLIVDVSVEITLLATLAGFPTVVIRQNGIRNDMPHLNAYQCAQILIAPCSETLMDISSERWVEEKTFFSGGFSRYAEREKSTLPTHHDKIGVLAGSGGTTLHTEVLAQMGIQCPDNNFHVIGQLSIESADLPKNVRLYGNVDDPSQILSTCAVVIGNAGHNTVMEMADLNKKFICITEPRPFDEQLCKGRLLESHSMCIVVRHDVVGDCDWLDLIEKARNLPQDSWNGVINPDALTSIANQLKTTWQANFG